MDEKMRNYMTLPEDTNEIKIENIFAKKIIFIENLSQYIDRNHQNIVKLKQIYNTM